MKNLPRTIVLGCGLVLLAGCGGDEIVSPGTSGDIIVNNPTPPPPPPPPPSTGGVTAATGCPTIAASGGLTDDGTISGPTGDYRVCILPATIDANTNLPYIQGLLYAMDGRVDVGTDGGPVASSADSDVTLSIEKGVIIFAGDAGAPNGESYLVVNRGNQINAVGSATQPIVFTSRDNVLGLATDNSIGQWGGVVLLGRAPVSDCRDGVFNKADQSQCEQELEGAALTTLFGGNDAADGSGTMRYFQIRYSGFTLTGGSELQSLTTGGIGSGTTIDHWQSFNSSDDGMEFFGGEVNMKYVVTIGADDDMIDVDTGAQANMQYVIAAQRNTGGDNIIELDSPDGDYSTSALPQTVLKVANFTFLERSTANSQAVRARGGAKLVLANGVIDTDNETCIRIDETVTLSANPDFYSIQAECDPSRPFRGDSGVTDGQVQAEFDAGTNNDASLTITLTNLFYDTSVTAYDPATLDAYFDTTSYIGAVSSANDTWYRDWTCNSAIVDFGSATGSCTSLPVY